MKKYIFRAILFAFIPAGFVGCEEIQLSKDYDIDLPSITVTSISEESPFVGDTIQIQGENLNTVQSIAVGVYTFPIVEKSNNTIKVIVPRIVEGGPFTISNVYKRQYESTQVLAPQFYPALVETWPTEIERGKPFVLKGKHLDLVMTVKVNGSEVALMGSASPDKVAYATAGIELGDLVVIEVTPKTGEKQTSAGIAVVAPKNTFTPQQTILLWDFETEPTTAAGWGDTPFTSGVVTDGFFGKAFEVTASAGNAWDGCYIKLTHNNGGQGFDLSAFNKPHITFLVNTNGKKGYINPALTIDGAESDKHFTGQGGQYTDNYVMQTNGWEWRSYDLEAMGWSNIKGKIDLIDLWFRGGNVAASDEFEIMIDQVMITDGALNPTLVWDGDAALGGTVPFVQNGGSGLSGYYQGTGYATYKYNVSASWDWVGAIASNDNLTLDPLVYANGIYMNFLVNTGNAEGYAVMEYVQGDTKLADQLPNGGAYGDNFQFKATNNQWEWRSMKWDPATLSVWGGSVDQFDMSKPFTANINIRSGNIASGAFEVNLDYFIFTTVPLDPNLKEE